MNPKAMSPKKSTKEITERDRKLVTGKSNNKSKIPIAGRSQTRIPRQMIILSGLLMTWMDSIAKGKMITNAQAKRTIRYNRIVFRILL
jgi:hypothetical protein